ncbi:MAG: nucleotidyltransferase family protein [Geminicoccaceae bacterium]|nr:nucleotidyltransferase family protein [Geminicoccaceae bacterium]
MTDVALLVQVLRDPSTACGLDGKAWDTLLRQSRSAGVSGKLGLLLEAAMPRANIPEAVRRATDSALTIAAKIERDVRLELYVLAELFADMPEPVILLKGTAYVAAGLEAARGRVFGDIDILVPQASLAPAESRLKRAGWSFGPIDAYDERYYRCWTHELPPMEHQLRGTLIDVHHAILQERRAGPDARVRMITDAQALDDRFRVLQPVDMVLHAAAHLFSDGEFDKGLRDLLDIVWLIRDFATRNTGFWDALLERATVMRLRRPLYHALDHASRLLGLEVPVSVFRGLDGEKRFDPIMRPAMHRGLMPHHSSAADGLTPLAHHFLYLRAHYLRMPLAHLALHLARKALRRDPVRENHPAPGAPPAPQRG